MGKYKVGGLFSGVGGIELGFKKNDFEIAWANEIDKNSCATYRKNFTHTLYEEDIRNLNLSNLIIASPDMGGSKRANAYAKMLESGVVVCYKERKKANIIGEMKILGDVAGRDVVIIDDMVDTAGTLTKAADLMIKIGANSVRAYCTHGILSGDAYSRIEKSEITELVITDTIPSEHNSLKVREISVSSFLAQTIKSVVSNRSISSNWRSNNK